MKIFRRFIRRRALFLTILIMSCVGAFIFFLTLSVQFKFIRNDYRPIDAMWYALAVLPTNMYTVFPELLVTIVWLFFYRLHARGELIHIFSTGITPQVVGGWLIMPWCTWVLCMVLVGECMGPILERHAKKMRMQAMLDYRVVEEEESLWLKEVDGFTEALRTSDHTTLIDLKRYIFKDDVLIAILTSPAAHYVEHNWHWENGEKISILPHIHRDILASYVWSTRLTPQLLSISSVRNAHKPLYQAIAGLWMDPLGLFTPQNIWSYYQRCFQPLELMLLVIGMSYGFARVILWRLHQYVMVYGLFIVCGVWCSLFVWTRFMHWLLPQAPFMGGLITLCGMVCCIYYVRRGSMVWLDGRI